jgi:very-short-patch-repair endonuclease
MWTLTCKKCQKEKSYTNRSNYNRAERGKQICNACSRKGQIRSPEQRKKISIATKVAMDNIEVKEKFLASYTRENRKKRSKSAKRQMGQMLKTDMDKLMWSEKISSGTKKKWKSRPISEKKSILSQLCDGRNKFIAKLEDSEYKKNHVRKILSGSGHKVTSPEKKVQTILDSNDWKYTFQYQVEDKVFDFYIESLNLLIEVDGVYWHGKNLNENQMNNMQLKHKKNDIHKNILANSKGYYLERIWEDEININLVLERIANYE